MQSRLSDFYEKAEIFFLIYLSDCDKYFYVNDVK